MASSPSRSLTVKRQSDTALMPPPPPQKRIKRPAQVLDEDDYTDALSHIIARDFFPGLLETQTQQEYLDAIESKDREWIANAGRRLSEVMTPGPRGRRGVTMTPRLDRSSSSSSSRPNETPKGLAGDTPMSTAPSTPSSVYTTSADAAQSKKAEGGHGPPDVSNMSLAAFQARYTSEDNESFNKVLDKQNAKHREKYAWMWDGNKIPTARQIAHRRREAKRIASQADPESIKNKQLVLSTDMDARPAKPDAWKVHPENSLMFIPSSSVEETHETVQQKAESTSRMGPKHVVYNNTRVQPEQPEGSNDDHDGSAPPPSPSISAIRDAIAGRPRPTDSEAGASDVGGGETPRVNGYSFVDEDEPSHFDESYHMRLLTSQLGTSASSTPNPFMIRETRRREALHHRVVDRVAKNKRSEKAAKDIKTPVPKFASSPVIAFGGGGSSSSNSKTFGASDGSGGSSGNNSRGLSKASLTPAAQRLWAKVGSATPKRTETGGSGLKNMWTPTPKKGK